MKKRLLGYTTLFALATQPLAYAHEVESPPPYEECYDDDEEDCFPQGTLVGPDSGEAVRTRRRTRWRNWGIALGVIAVGITTLILVSNKH